MKFFTVHYAYKSNHKFVYTLTINAIDEQDARRIAYNKIDNRIYEVLGAIAL